MRRRNLIAAALAAVVMLSSTACGAAGAPPAKKVSTAAPKAHTRYSALAGSATHLLYDTVLSAKVNGSSADNPTFVLDDTGRRTRVPTGWSASLLTDRPLFIRDVKIKGVPSVRWRYPESGRSGTTAIPKGSVRSAAVPDGWLTSVRTFVDSSNGDYGFKEHLTRWTNGAVSTDLGVPNPTAAPFDLAVSDTGLIAFSYPGDGGDFQPDGTVKYMAWSAPGVWTTLFPSPGTANKGVYDIQCKLSSALASCSVEDPTQSLLFPVSHLTRPAVVVRGSRCDQYGGTPLAASTVWTVQVASSGCRVGTLARYTLSGKLQRSTRTYAAVEPVIAMHRIVVASKDRRTLFILTSVEGTPKRLIGR